MKVKFTGQADASVTYMGKYEVETGSVLVVDDVDANALLQTGHFEAVEDAEPAAKEDSSAKKDDIKDDIKDDKSDSKGK